MQAGRLITLEGPDGVGKTTQWRRLEDRLRLSGVEVVATREPGGCPGAEEIRDLVVRGLSDRWQPSSELCLFMAARMEHLHHVIRPALARGCWVLCDRFIDSTLVYQGDGMGLSVERIMGLYDWLSGGLWPDRTLVLLPRSVALPSKDSAELRYESMPQDFQLRLEAGFRRLSDRFPDRCQAFSSDGGEDEVTERLWSGLRSLL